MDTCFKDKKTTKRSQSSYGHKRWSFCHFSLSFVLYLSLVLRIGVKIFLMVLKPLNRVKKLFALWIALNMP